MGQVNTGIVNLVNFSFERREQMTTSVLLIDISAFPAAEGADAIDAYAGLPHGVSKVMAKGVKRAAGLRNAAPIEVAGEPFLKAIRIISAGVPLHFREQSPFWSLDHGLGVL